MVTHETQNEVDLKKLPVDWTKMDGACDATIAAQIAADLDTAAAWMADDVARARWVCHGRGRRKSALSARGWA